MRLLTKCWIVLGCCGCAEIDRTVYPASSDMTQLFAQFEQQADGHEVDLVDELESGARLTVLGRLLSQEDGQPLPHHPILFYQANSEGDYDEAVPGVESSARIRGTVVTDSAGRFLLRTVLPGDYGSTSNNRHIHMAITDAKPDAYDFYFAQYINRGLLRWANGTDQAIVLDLKDGGNVLLAITDLPVRGVTNR